MKLSFIHSRHSRQKHFVTRVRHRRKDRLIKDVTLFYSVLFFRFFKNKIVLTRRNLSLFEQGTLAHKRDNENRQYADKQCMRVRHSGHRPGLKSAKEANR